MEQQQEYSALDLIEIPIQITIKNNVPTIQLRTSTCDPALLKFIISSAFHEKNIVIKPVFKKKLFSVNNLIEKGLIYYDSVDKEYKYTF